MAFEGEQQTSDIVHKMTRTGAILSIISTIVGGGIVSLPHSFYFIGIILGAVSIILAAA